MLLAKISAVTESFSKNKIEWYVPVTADSFGAVK